MTIDILTISIPIDGETKEEIEQFLMEQSKIDSTNSSLLLSEYALTDDKTKGFVIVAYDEEKLVGVATAIDLIGLHTYEASMIVHSTYRNEGIGRRMFATLENQLSLRGAEATLGLCPHESESGQLFLKQINWTKSLSEATLRADVEQQETEVPSIRQADLEKDADMIQHIWQLAFGDSKEEVASMWAFHSSDPTRTIFVNELNHEVASVEVLVSAEDELWVTALATNPVFQGKGLAKELLHFAKHEAFRQQKSAVYLDVEIDNERALHIYQQAGFHVQNQIDFYEKRD